MTTAPGAVRAPSQAPRSAPLSGVGSVGMLLVTHNGARWLPTVLEGVRSQRVQPDETVVVDTGSKDDSVALVSAALGAEKVVEEPRATSFPTAVRRGLEELTRRRPDLTWLWIVHDDLNPDEHCLERLLAAAADDPEAACLGPKLREWPSLRRLLEVGVTVSGTGRRETGLEPGEYDQGQHDEIRDVLAVNTAGMLVRVDAFEQVGGLDEALAVFGNDLDFGWRAARAGLRTVVVPGAVAFHAEAAHRGVRRTALTGSHTHLSERRGAIYTLLANVSARALPFVAVRVLFGSLLRMLGFLLVRSPGAAGDELAAVLSVFLRPGQVRAARRERATRDGDPRRARGLLAPAWTPYRHGLDAVSDFAAAATNQAADVAERRRADRMAQRGEAPPRHLDDDELDDDSGLLVRFVTDPVALLTTLGVVALLVAARDAVGSGALSGSGLSPAPGSVTDWWHLYTDARHPLGQGTDTAAPGYVPALAVLGTLLFGHPGAAVSAILLFAAPLALWGAWRLLRVVGRFLDPRGAPSWLLLVVSMAYALTGFVSGAWAAGRLGTLVVIALLPWLAHAALGFADPDPDRRWRAAWRTTALLALQSAFAPMLWCYAVLATVLTLVAGLVVARDLVRDRTIGWPLALPVLVTPVLLAPWLWPMLLAGHWQALLLDSGRLPLTWPERVSLLAGRVADGAPLWLGLLVVGLAVVAAVAGRSRRRAVLPWALALPAGLLVLAVSGVTLSLPGGDSAAGAGVPVAVLAVCTATAAFIGAMTWTGWLSAGAVRLAAGAALLVALLVVPVAGVVWALGPGHPVLDHDADTGIPVYMVQNEELDPAHGVLVLDGSVATGLDYRVERGGGVSLGEDEILAFTDPDDDVTANVRALVSDPGPATIRGLAARGIEYVVLRAPADGDVAAVLDATDGLEQASAEDSATRAWHVAQAPDESGLAGSGSWQRWLLIAVQILAVIVVAVQCGPSRSATPEGRRR